MKNADYEAALEMAKTLDDLTFIGIPGQTSKIMNDALMAFCDNNGYFPFLDMPMGSTAEETRQYRKTISAWTGALGYVISTHLHSHIIGLIFIVNPICVLSDRHFNIITPLTLICGNCYDSVLKSETAEKRKEEKKNGNV